MTQQQLAERVGINIPANSENTETGMNGVSASSVWENFPPHLGCRLAFFLTGSCKGEPRWPEAICGDIYCRIKKALELIPLLLFPSPRTNAAGLFEPRGGAV